MSIPKMMKAAVVDKFREPLSIREVSVPAPLPGEVLVEIVASGVCHTDLHAADGDWPVKPTAPFIPGHEGAGIVVALGAVVTHLKEGDRVGIAWLHSACGHCEFCLSGWEALCSTPSGRRTMWHEFPRTCPLWTRRQSFVPELRRIKD